MFIRVNPHSVAEIDSQDFPLVAQFKWTVNGRYAETKINGKTVSMHRLIKYAKEGDVVDHINGEGLDNRRSNLRIVTVQGNALNRRLNVNNHLGFRGVSRSKYGYVASIKISGKNINLGTFPTAGEASEAFQESDSQKAPRGFVILAGYLKVG